MNKLLKQNTYAFEQYATDIETLRLEAIKMQENEELKKIISWNPHEQCSKNFFGTRPYEAALKN
jgi:hypothetical protein